MFNIIEQSKTGDLHLYSDPDTQLRAVIAIHNTDLGPAIGGCRCIAYKNEATAVNDAIRLAKGMSYKAALAGLPHGGGKSVIMCPEEIKDRHAFFQKFGECVNTLNGRYITSVDSGTNITDMDDISVRTSYVCGTSSDGCKPSPFTALGVFEGLKAAVRVKLKRNDIEDLHVAIQGIGNVGAELAHLLIKAGAKLTIADISNSHLKNFLDTLEHPEHITVIHPDEIYDINCNVFAPCGLGGILNKKTISRLKCSIVAGSANNQLLEESDGRLMHEHNISYVPDYVLNAGGLINVSLAYEGKSNTEVEEKTIRIGATIENLLERAQLEETPSNIIANNMAENILYGYSNSTAV